MRLRSLLLTTALVAAPLAMANGYVNPAVIAPGKEFPTPTQGQPNPNPFPPPSAQPPPVVVPAPQVTVTNPKGDEGWLGWIFAALGALFTTIFGVRTAGEFRKPKIDLDDPSFRARLDSLLVQAIETGVPGRLISRIPGVGIAEPLIRRSTLSLLRRRIRELEERAGLPPSPEIEEIGAESDLLDRIFQRLGDVEKRLGQPSSR